MKITLLALFSVAVAKALISCNEKPYEIQLCRDYSKKLNNYYGYDLNGNRSLITVDAYFKFMDVIQVSDTDKSITLLMRVMISWQDLTQAYGVTGPYGYNDSSVSWTAVPVPISDYDKVLKPSLMFLDAYKIEKIELFGSDGFNYFWFYNRWPKFESAEYLKVKLGCNFDFQSFPFDSHVCYLKYLDPGYDVHMLDFAMPWIYTQKNDEQKNDTIDLETPRIPFRVQVEPFMNKSIRIGMMGYHYNVQGLRITLQRSNIMLLITGFYIPTALFALIAMLALSVTIDDISDRISIVLTIFLISMTLYVTVDAPHDRGMSYIEVWIIGMQVPPIIVLLESTTILIKMRRLKRKHVSIRHQIKVKPAAETDTGIDEIETFEDEKQNLAQYDPIITLFLIVYFVLFLSVYAFSAIVVENEF